MTQPALLIWGEHDDQTPVADAYAIANELDDSELLVVQDAGHFVHVEQPAVVLEKIDEFLK
jgi:pimeloyl-ACP methyl ester carboxylesterase